MMEKLDKMMATDIPRLMNLIPHEDRELKEDGRTQVTNIYLLNFWKMKYFVSS